MTDSAGTGPVDGLFDHIDWKQSTVFGVGAWIVGLVISYAIVSLSDVTDVAMLREESTLDLATVFYYESIGGVIESDLGGEAQLESGMVEIYSLLDSNFWGAAIVVHHIVPLTVLTIAGFVLAGRYKHGNVDGVSDPTPIQTTLGGASLAVGFAAAMILGMLIFGSDATYDTGQLIVVSLLFPLVFASFGAGLRTSVRTLASGWGFIGGVAAAVVGTGLWYVIEDPLDPLSIGDLSGLTDHLNFLLSYFAEGHPVEYGEVLPEWYVMLGLAALSAGIVYRAETDDWLRGMGQGARIGVGYFVVAFVVVLGAYGSQMNDMLDTNASRADLVEWANLLFGAAAPRLIIVGGILWAVAFGAIGGAIGAKIVESQADQAQTATAAAGGDPAE